MSGKIFSVAAFAGAITSLALVAPAAGQPSAPSSGASSARTAKSTATKKNWTPPRTADGQPDLQGIWTNVTITPLERPLEFAGKEFLTEKEAAAYETRTVEANNADRRDLPPEADVGRAYNDAWYDRGTKVIGTRRTSLIVDPPDGRIPALTPEAQRQVSARAESRREHPADGPEDRSLAERCLLWPTAGPPMLPSFYNNNYQIVQGPGYVAIYVEMIHDVRIIPIDGRPHPSSNIRQWMGDSRGHWEGDTLVVETANFNGKGAFRGSGQNLHLTERFTRVDQDTVLYRFTVDDPETFTKPWTGEVPMRRTKGPIYEYACHEGNYAMVDMLAGARAEEKKAAGKSREGAK
jgi:hypothetical protein